MRKSQIETKLAEQKAALRDQRERVALKDRLSEIKPSDVREVLWGNAATLHSGNRIFDLLYEDEKVRAFEMDRPALRQVLIATVSRIVLDPKTRELKLTYRIPLATGVKGASPRGFEPRLPP